MKIERVLLVALLASGLVVSGCAAKDDSSALGAAEAQMVEDDQEAEATDEDTNVLDNATSGAPETAPDDMPAPPENADKAALETFYKTNPGLFFKPAGCIATEATPDPATKSVVVKHVFTNCTGPYGMTSFNGTVTATWTKDANGLKVVRSAKDFKINGATVSYDATITYTKSGTTVSRTRTAKLTGTTAKGAAISHDANFTVTYDAAAKCITRNGSSTSSIGNRSLSRTIENWKRCGIGRLGCPDSGKITLTRGTTKLVLDFPGGAKVNVTLPNGQSFVRPILCNPLAK